LEITRWPGSVHRMNVASQPTKPPVGAPSLGRLYDEDFVGGDRTIWDAKLGDRYPDSKQYASISDAISAAKAATAASGALAAAVVRVPDGAELRNVWVRFRGQEGWPADPGTWQLLDFQKMDGLKKGFLGTGAPARAAGVVGIFDGARYAWVPKVK
jgi:hypothetical protein